MSLLRKQQSRLLCACSGVPVWQAGPGNMDCCYFLDCRFRGNAPYNRLRFALSRPSRQGSGELLHSAKELPNG